MAPFALPCSSGIGSAQGDHITFTRMPDGIEIAIENGQGDGGIVNLSPDSVARLREYLR